MHRRKIARVNKADANVRVCDAKEERGISGPKHLGVTLIFTSGALAQGRATDRHMWQQRSTMVPLPWPAETRHHSTDLERMMCPRCGNRRVNLIFEPPTVAKRATVA
jgi:hypothetical protein